MDGADGSVFFDFVVDALERGLAGDDGVVGVGSGGVDVEVFSDVEVVAAGDAGAERAEAGFAGELFGAEAPVLIHDDGTEDGAVLHGAFEAVADAVDLEGGGGGFPFHVVVVGVALQEEAGDIVAAGAGGELELVAKGYVDDGGVAGQAVGERIGFDGDGGSGRFRGEGEGGQQGGREVKLVGHGVG